MEDVKIGPLILTWEALSTGCDQPFEIGPLRLEWLGKLLSPVLPIRSPMLRRGRTLGVTFYPPDARSCPVGVATSPERLCGCHGLRYKSVTMQLNRRARMLKMDDIGAATREELRPTHRTSRTRRDDLP